MNSPIRSCETHTYYSRNPNSRKIPGPKNCKLRGFTIVYFQSNGFIKKGLLHRKSLFQILETIKFQYTNWTYPDDSHQRFKHLVQLVGDWQYNCPADYLTDSLKHSNIYKYRFEVQNPMDNWPLWTGVKHGAELDYIFGRPLGTTLNDKDDPFRLRDLEVSLIMMSAWANFVKHG